MKLILSLLLLAVSGTLVAQTSPPTQNPAPNAGATVTAPQTNLTGTAITACGSITAPGSYYLSGNLSCPGTALLLSGPGIDLNLNGYTITYGTAGGTLGQVYGIENDACWDTGDTHGAIAVPCDTASDSAGAVIYNGYIVQSANAPGFSHAFFFGQNNNGNGKVIDIHDVDITMQQTGTQAFYGGVAGQNLFEHNTIHDNVVSINLPGQGDLSARSQFQGQAVMVDDSKTTASPDQLDNNLIIGSPQGGIRDTATGALIYENDISMNSTYTNDFCVDVPGTNEQVYDNYCHPVNGRGIHVNGIGGNIYGNLIIVTEAAVNAEYGGCEEGGAYGIQLEADIQAAGGSVITDNNSTLNTGACGGGALRMTDWAATSPATISNNIWTVNKTAGADQDGGYNYYFDADQLNDVTFGPNEHLVSNDNACIGIDWDGETGLNVAMPDCHANYIVDSENGNNDPTYDNNCDNCNSSFTITQAPNTNLLCGPFATTTGTINGTPVQCPEGAAASVTVVSGSGQSAAVGSPFASPLVVIVKDANGDSLSNVSVSFSGTSVSFPSGASVLTNSSGEAEVTAQPESPGTLNITASTSGASTSATFTETGTATSTAVLKSITLNGLGPGTTVHLKAAATTPAVIQLSSSNPNVISAPATVIVPTGATSVATGTLLGSLWTPAGSAETAVLSATLNGVTQVLTVTLYSPGLHSFACKPAKCPAVEGGQPYNFTLELSGMAPVGGSTVQITSSNPAVIPSQTVAIPAGQNQPATSSVAITTNAVTATATVTVTATFNGTTISVGPITVNPAEAIKSVTSDGGSSPGSTVNLTAAAPAGGLAVQIGSSDQSVAYAPATVTVPAGQTSAEIGTLLGSLFGPAGTSQSATISATYNNITKSLAKTYTSPSISTFGCTTTPCLTVTGGQAISFNLAVSKSAAPVGGATVTISSDTPAVIPTQMVQIAAGQNSPASVPVLINTNTVTTNTVVHVMVSFNGDIKKATGGAITVTP